MAKVASGLELAEGARNVYALRALQEHSFEDVLNPSYWVNVTSYLKPGSQIEVTAADNTWFAQLYVVAASKMWAKVVPLHFYDLTSKKTIKTPVNDEFYVKWANDKLKFRVHRKSDKQALKDGFDTQELAKEYIEQLKKELA